MVIAAGVYILEFTGFVVTSFRVRAFKEEAFNLIGGVQHVAFFFVHLLGKDFQRAADISAVRCSALVYNFAKDEHLAGAKDICLSPVERAPIQAQTQIAFALRGKATD